MFRKFLLQHDRFLSKSSQFTVSGYPSMAYIQYFCFTYSSASPTEWFQWEERGETVPVYGLARPWGARVSHSHSGLPTASKGLQSSRCRAYGGPLQVGAYKNEVILNLYSPLNVLYQCVVPVHFKGHHIKQRCWNPVFRVNIYFLPPWIWLNNSVLCIFQQVIKPHRMLLQSQTLCTVCKNNFFMVQLLC